MAAVFARSAAARHEFEGVATYRTTVEGKAFETRYHAKGGKLRQELSMGGMQTVTITDDAAGKDYTLVPAQKKFMVLDFKAMADAAKSMVDSQKQKPKVMQALTPTGKRETIAGHVCDHFTMVTENGGQVDMCAAKGMGNFMSMSGAARGANGMSSDDPRLRELIAAMKDGFFPLRTTFSKGGKVMMESVAVSVEPKPVPAALFAPPADYSELKLPSIPGLLKRP